MFSTIVRKAAMASDRSKPGQSWTDLPVRSRWYVATITFAGLAALVAAVSHVTEAEAPLLTTLAVLSFMTAFAKVTVAVPGSASTVSFCYVIDFITLLVLGPAAAAMTAASGVWSQATFGTSKRGPSYRTWFSIATLALTVSAAGSTLASFGYRPGGTSPLLALMAILPTAAVYFLTNTMLVAGAVALTTRQRALTVWRKNYLSLWSGHLFGFTLAVIAAIGLMRSKLWLFPLTLAVLWLTYDKFRAYVEGLSESLADPMTELPNLRYLRVHVAQEINRARREQKTVAVLMIDVNDFKSINDTYGHSAGNLALRHVAQRLQASIRSYDLCARYAGDEFVVVLPGCPVDEARRKAGFLQRAVADHRFEPAGGVAVALRISVGSAVFPENGNTLDELLSVADHEMFRDKHRANDGATTFTHHDGEQVQSEDLAGVTVG